MCDGIGKGAAHRGAVCIAPCFQAYASPTAVFTSKPGIYAAKRIAATAAGLRLVYHVSKLTLRVPLVFTKKHGIYAAKLMLRLRLAFVNRTYYTMTPRNGHNKTARAAVLDGSMFSRPCAPAQKRVLCTRAAAQAAALRLLYHIWPPRVPAGRP